MPVTPTYPGVYIQEIPSGVRTITSVATSIAAFFGRATKGPINKAVRILSYSDYERKFGEPFAKSDLANSVSLFLNNGGSDCYVIRLAQGAEPASVTLKSLGDDEVLAVTAKAEGVWGDAVRLEVDYNTPNPDETFNLRVIQEEGGSVVRTELFPNLSMNWKTARYAPEFVTQSSELVDMKLSGSLGDPSLAVSDYNTDTFAGFCSSRRPLAGNAGAIRTTLNNLIAAGQSKFQISVNDSPYVTVDLAGTPPIPGSFSAIADNIRDKILAALASLTPVPSVTCSFVNIAPVGRILQIVGNDPVAGNNVSVRIRRAAENDIAAALMLGVDQGGIEPVRWSNFRPAPTAAMLVLGDAAAPGGDVATVNTLANLTQPTILKITIDGVDVEFSGDHSLLTDAGERWVKNAPGKSTVTDDNDGVREKLKIMAKAINEDTALDYKAEVWGYHLALSTAKGTINTQPTASAGNATFDGATATTGFISNVRQYTLGIGGSGSFSTNGTKGDDGSAPGQAEYMGSESNQTGFYALDSVDLFNLMILPEDEEVDEATMLKLWGPASNYCANNRAFLMVDAPGSWTDNKGRPAVVGDTGMINDLRISIVKDHAAVFYPRLQYSDQGLTKFIAPAGAIAGLMARTDASRGVWKAPAGIEAGIRNVLGVQLKLTDAENGVLNKKGVNCIRVFPNGVVNWGSRTLDGDDDFGSEWKYIPVRRLALMIEESLFRGTRWVVFEPNDEPLWAKIRLNVGAFMMSLFRQGAFQGTSPKEAFFVKCDKETTIQDDINKGIVNIRVGFAPLKPAEFVVITIQQMAGEL